MKLLIAICVMSLVACTSGPPLRDYDLDRTQIELSATPFFAQDEYQCGPAALATVLVAAGAPVTPEELTPSIYIPGRQGSLQAEIVAATRRHGRVPYILTTKLADLLAEVGSGNPVLVMQNLGLTSQPQWHYAVVIGYDAPADMLVLRSGTTKRLQMNRVRFQGTWARAGNWALVAAAPNQPPTTADSSNWLQAASAFEELDQTELASQSYRAATLRWPDEPLTWQALANALYTQDDLTGAEFSLRQSLALAPSAAAHNNLAHVLHKQGCLVVARIEIDRADTMVDAEQFAEVLASTRAAIAADTSSSSCPAEAPARQGTR